MYVSRPIRAVRPCHANGIRHPQTLVQLMLRMKQADKSISSTRVHIRHMVHEPLHEGTGSFMPHRRKTFRLEESGKEPGHAGRSRPVPPPCQGEAIVEVVMELHSMDVAPVGEQVCLKARLCCPILHIQHELQHRSHRVAHRQSGHHSTSTELNTHVTRAADKREPIEPNWPTGNGSFFEPADSLALLCFSGRALYEPLA